MFLQHFEKVATGFLLVQLINLILLKTYQIQKHFFSEIESKLSIFRSRLYDILTTSLRRNCWTIKQYEISEMDAISEDLKKKENTGNIEGIDWKKKTTLKGWF